MSAQENMNTMHKYFDLLWGKEMDNLLALFANDIEYFVVATGTTFKGMDQFRAGAANHWAASPNREKKLVNLFATDDYACLEYTSGGTLTGEADFGDLKIKPTGRKYELQCCFVFHFRPDGLIDRVREYFDMETVHRQTGQGPVTTAPVSKIAMPSNGD